MRPRLKSIVAAAAAALALAAGPAFAQEVSPAVTVEDCLASVEAALGGDALHLEYESRGGTPTYEFIIGAGGIEYYVGCDATTGLIGEVDLIVKADDPRWTALAKVDEAAAKKAATERYKGGEFNVYVDAATGSITLVNIEYWEIGRPGVEDDD
jgi:uncharacterized membrane protein YkoI